MGCGQNEDTSKVGGTLEAASVAMLYRGTGSAQIRGPVTGQIYPFTRQQPVQAVDWRDAGSLIRTRLFTLVHSWT